LLPGTTTAALRESYVIPGLAERLLANVYIVPKYLLTVIWPLNLSPAYEVPKDLRGLTLPLLAGWGAHGC
jgi:hypothetical protein